MHWRGYVIVSRPSARPFVGLSVCGVQVCFSVSHKVEYFDSYFTADLHDDLVQRQRPRYLGGIWVGLWAENL